jgi:hypothetical protein
MYREAFKNKEIKPEELTGFFTDEWGIDLARDVERVTLTTTGTKDKPSDRFFLLAQGRFHADRLETKLRGKKATAVQPSGLGRKYHRIVTASNKTNYVALVGTGAFLLTDHEDAIVHVLEKTANRATAGFKDPAVLRFLARLDPDEAMQFFCGRNFRVDAEKDQLGDLGIRSISAGVTLGDRLQFRAICKCKDAKTADTLQRWLHTYVKGAAEKEDKYQPLMKALLEGEISVQPAESALVIACTLTREEIAESLRK